jgi:hypothetical protein
MQPYCLLMPTIKNLSGAAATIKCSAWIVPAQSPLYIQALPLSKCHQQQTPKVTDTIKIKVAQTIAPFIKFTDEKKLREEVWTPNDKITLNVEYHAGSGNKVIASDEGGIRFWLRHFQSKWIPVKDIVLLDSNALKTESGKSSMSISLEGLTPSAELPSGQFYQLRASFTSSNGQMYDTTIDDIKIVPAH